MAALYNRKYLNAVIYSNQTILKKLKTTVMKKISISFDRYSDINFQKKSQFIYDSMKDNTIYADLASSVTDMKTLLDAYILNLQAAETKERNAVALKNESRQQLAAFLKPLGMNVMAIANGNEPALVSSGYSLVKNPEPRYITNPGNVILSQGLSSGEMISAVTAVPGAKSYVHQITTEYLNEQTIWISNTSSTSKFLFTNLIPGKQYWVRVAVIGSRNQVAYTSVATWFAQ